MSKKLALLMAALLVMCAVSWADDITVDELEDPATLHTGTGAGGTCYSGGCYVFGKEVNGFNGHTIDIFQENGGAGTLHSPWLLILGVPNASNPALFSNSSISSVISTNKYPGGVTSVGSATFGGAAQSNWNGHGYAGSMTKGDVYHQSFFTGSHLYGSGIDASNSFTNWHNADLKVNGINASSFGIYIFAITAPLSGKGLTNISFKDDGTLPQGTFVVAYGNDGKNVYVNAFTEAGLQEHHVFVTPEPGSMALLGSGLIGMAGFARRKFRK